MQDIVPIEKKPLRDRIMDIVDEEPASINDILKTLRQCSSHIQDTIQVSEIIKQNGLSYKKFITNDKLELYYDLVRPEDNTAKDLGYIAKGWDDPGFRLGDVINFEDLEESEFKDYLDAIYPECANQGIIINAQEEENGFIMQLEGLIYSEGFNKDTFNQTLQALNDSVDLAQAFKCAMLGYMDEWDDTRNKLPEAEKKDEDDLQY